MLHPSTQGIPPPTDQELAVPARIFVLFPTPPPPRPGQFDVVIPPGTPWLEAEEAICCGPPGTTVLLSAGEWTIEDPLQLPAGISLWGAEGGGTTIRTAGGNSDPYEVVRVGGDGVTLGDLRICQMRNSHSEVEIAASVGSAGRVQDFTMVGCELESTEICLSLRAEDWWVDGCSFSHVGPPGRVHWHVEVLGSTGVGVIRGCGFWGVGGGGNHSTSEFVRLTSRASGDGFSGVVSVSGCTHPGGRFQRFLLMDSFGGGADGFELVVHGNTFSELDGAVVLRGASAGYADVLSAVTLSGNSSAGAGKGLLGFDASVPLASARTSPLPLHLGSNAVASSALSSGWSSVLAPGIVARSSNVGSVLLAADSYPRFGQFPPR